MSNSSSTCYPDLKLEKFARLVNDLIGAGTPCALFNTSGSMIWTSSPTQGLDVPGLLGALARMRSDNPDSAVLEIYDPTYCHKLICRGLSSGSEEDLGFLSIILDPACEPVVVDRARSLLRHICESLQDEFELSQELNQMAEELGARYEELNLIYSIEEQVKKYDSESGRNVIQHLVEDCARYLEVDAVIFSICDENFEIAHTCNSKMDASEIWSGLEGPIMGLVEECRAAVVLNDEQDPRWNGIPHLKGLRLLAAPLVDVKGRVRGVLAILNRRESVEFNNGQRRLIEVLAEQASAILQANQDVLTGLLNRVGFEHHLSLLLPVLESNDQTHALLQVDLDRFQLINDTAGHGAGDEILRQVATLLSAHTRSTDLVARIGGDQFAVFLQGCPPERTVELVTKLLRAIKENRFWWEGKPFDFSVSVGIVPISSRRIDVSELISSAETACAMVKERGGDGFQFFDEEDTEISRRHGQAQWVPRIRSALAENRFTLYAQPIVPIVPCDAPVHYEVLLRMLNEQGEVVPPLHFIPVAERFQFMCDIDRWVVREALRALACDLGDWHCSINLSGQSLTTAGFLEEVLDLIGESGVARQRLCFEITETAAISNYSDAMVFIKALKEEGCAFSLDDFGSGLSSFGYLKNLPMDYLKIDGMFVKDMESDPVSAEMVRCMAELGRVVGLRTIAEFVENDNILHMLREARVDFAQGYGVGKPRPLDEQLCALSSAADYRQSDVTYG